MRGFTVAGQRGIKMEKYVSCTIKEKAKYVFDVIFVLSFVVVNAKEKIVPTAVNLLFLFALWENGRI